MEPAVSISSARPVNVRRSHEQKLKRHFKELPALTGSGDSPEVWSLTFPALAEIVALKCMPRMCFTTEGSLYLAEEKSMHWTFILIYCNRTVQAKALCQVNGRKIRKEE